MTKEKICLLFFIFAISNIVFPFQELPSLDVKSAKIQVVDRPDIDGELNDSVWKNASYVENFYLLSGEKLASEQTKVYFLYDEDNIYVAFICYFKDYEAKIKEIKENAEKVFAGDAVELFIDPGRTFAYTHIAVNPAGTIFFSGGKHNIVVGTKVFQDRYQIEIAVPFKDIKFPKPEEIGSDWGINFCRSNPKIKEWSCWSATLTGFHNPAKFGILKGIKVDNKKFYLAQKERKENPGNLLSIETDRTFYDCQKEIMVNIRVSPETSLKNTLLKVQIQDKKNKVIIEQNIRPVLFTNQEKISISSLPEDKYIINVLLVNGENIIGKVDKIFWKIKPMPEIKEKIEIKNNVLYIDGNPFFPIGTAGFGLGLGWELLGPIKDKEKQVQLVEEMAKDLSTHGFNTVIPSGDFFKEILKREELFKKFASYPKEQIKALKDTQISMDEVLEILKKYNLRAILYPPFLNSESLDYEQIEAWSEIMFTYRENTTIIAWWQSDESDGWVERNEKVYKLYHELDPYRPVWLNVINAVTENKDAGDILSTDPYPIPNIPITLIPTHADRLKKIIGKNPRQSFWLYLQMYGSEHEKKRCPTPKEERCMVFLSLNHGVKGLFYHVYQPKQRRNKGALTEELWQYMKELNYQTKEMAPVYLLGKDVEGITSNCNQLDIAAKEYEGDFYIIACNTTEKETSAQIIPTLTTKLVKEIEVLFESRKILPKNNIIEDNFSEYDVHIYKIHGGRK